MSKEQGKLEEVLVQSVFSIHQPLFGMTDRSRSLCDSLTYVLSIFCSSQNLSSHSLGFVLKVCISLKFFSSICRPLCVFLSICAECSLVSYSLIHPETGSWFPCPVTACTGLKGRSQTYQGVDNVYTLIHIHTPCMVGGHRCMLKQQSIRHDLII